jgi:hypothetical protein
LAVGVGYLALPPAASPRPIINIKSVMILCTLTNPPFLSASIFYPSLFSNRLHRLPFVSYFLVYFLLVLFFVCWPSAEI